MCFNIFNHIKAQTLPNVPTNEAAVGVRTTSEVFQYDNKSIGYYSLGWYWDSWYPGATTSFLSSFGGLKFFTSGQSRLSITSGGNVGIGTTNPLAKLDVGISSNDALSTVLARLPEGNHVESGTYLGVRAINTTTVGGSSFSLEHRFYGKVNSSIDFHRGGSIEGGFITFSTGNGTESMRLDENGNLGLGKLKEGATNLSLAMSQESNGYVRMQSVKSQGVSYGDLIFNEFGGNVGIGTNDAKGYKLAVAGNVIAEEVKVKLRVNWPDYVFSKEYKLPTLQETEQHIKEKGYLPGVPSAEEVKNNGIDLGEMNAKLLQKIEELTLHLIEQQKQIEKLNQENVKIKELEMKINQLTVVK